LGFRLRSMTARRALRDHCLMRSANAPRDQEIGISARA
jgi:hypothetical protein